MKYLSILTLFFALNAGAVTIGDDDRMKEEAYPTGELAKKYRGVGAIECTFPNNPPEDRKRGATASVTVNDKIVVTAAHTFLNNDGTEKTDLSNCMFYIFSSEGSIVKKSKIKKLWPGAVRDFDSAQMHNDWAIVELENRIPDVYKFGVKVYQPNRNEPVRICQFNSDLPDKTKKRCMEGLVRNWGSDNFEANPYLVFHDIDTKSASSGAPLFLPEEEQTIYGLNIGAYSVNSSGDYNLNSRYNIALVFTDDFISTFKSVLAEIDQRVASR